VFIEDLPCALCRAHAAEYVARRPPDLADTHAFQSWAWTFHNAVNLRLGRRAIPFSEYQAAYGEELCRAGWSVGCRLRRP
jgi:Erv1 / Alr family